MTDEHGRVRVIKTSSGLPLMETAQTMIAETAGQFAEGQGLIAAVAVCFGAGAVAEGEDPPVSIGVGITMLPELRELTVPLLRQAVQAIGRILAENDPAAARAMASFLEALRGAAR